MKPFTRLLYWVLGAIAANIATAALYFVVAMFVSRTTAGGMLAIPSLFLVPFFGGYVASYCWKSLKPSYLAGVGGSVLTTLLAVLGAYVFLREGIICLLIVAPLYFASLTCGVMLSICFRRHRANTMNAIAVPLVAMLATGEVLSRNDQPGKVVDEVLIKAPPATVWPQVTSFPTIPARPTFWLFRLGLPYPVQTTKEGDFVGADRKCVFSGGAIFDETVTRCVPNSELTFDIESIPPDPELLGHVTPYRGQFVLKDNGNGTTTLIGTSWYRIHVRPLWYFDWWTQEIIRAVHVRVMEDIRSRAELAAL